ncbi:hypothetical protein TSAR_016731 [Trichomalopsis sarcophagae]|uniref:Uncharacterized protein n=1 Tax=Trichomalopsis sarcophagae TaxID=543379 RepID=A0A232EZK1_9HYME|nr:hypothetical protein TSAR_016731 [Trichomalopsis sarcophagae]
MILLPENYYANCLCRRESRCRPEVFGRKEDGKCEPPAKKAAENKCPPAKVKPEGIAIKIITSIDVYDSLTLSSPLFHSEIQLPQQQQPSSCGCGRRSAGKSKRPPRSRNPFIIFYRRPKDNRRGSRSWKIVVWHKEVYRKMARLEQKRRQRKSRRRRHECRR